MTGILKSDAFDQYAIAWQSEYFKFLLTIQYRVVHAYQTNGFFDNDISFFLGALMQQNGITSSSHVNSLLQWGDHLVFTHHYGAGTNGGGAAYRNNKGK